MRQDGVCDNLNKEESNHTFGIHLNSSKQLLAEGQEELTNI